MRESAVIKMAGGTITGYDGSPGNEMALRWAAGEATAGDGAGLPDAGAGGHRDGCGAGLETAMVSSGEAGKIERRMVVEYGITLDGVWLPLAMLRRLGTHGPWDPPFTEATAGQERVLLAHALAERHNQAGLHRGISLPDLLDAVPFQPTVPFGKIPDGARTTSVAMRNPDA